jgi:Holliday junction resolvase-like predicted endonuclease
VEVRTRRGDSFGTAKDSVSRSKQLRLASVARSYLQERDLVDVDWGIDVVAIELMPGGRLRQLELIRNAVSESS